VRVRSEGPVKITRTEVEKAWRRRAPGLRLVVRDLGCRGLALVVNPTGMSWTYSYKLRGSDPRTGRRFATQSVTIGSPETHPPDAARDAANAVKGQSKEAGADPAEARRAAVRAAAARRALTVARLFDDYAKALPRRPKLRGSGLPSPKHVAEDLAHVRAAIATMKAGDALVAEVGAADLRVLLRAEAGRPATARARFGALSRFFDWCQDEGHVAVNPCALVAKARRPRAAEARHHFLTLADLARL
jgi:hypothetical protein